VTVLSLAYGVSYAALIFSGNLTNGVGAAIDAALIAVAIGGLLVALRSGFPFAIGGPDSNPTAVLAVLAASVGAAEHRMNAVPTVLMLMTLAAACTGALFFALGRFRAGRIIRFVPQSMIDGFTAASGVLVSIGAFRVLGTNPAQIAAGAGFGALLLVLRRLFGAKAIPSALVAVLAAMLALGWLEPGLLGTLRAKGWFFSLPHVTPWVPWLNAGAVDWSMVLIHVPDIIVIALVASAALLLNATGLELLAGQDVDLDRELRIAGIANILTACAGGMVSYATFSRSSANFALGTRNRVVGAVAACAAALVVVAGPERIINYVPIFAAGGVLISVGVELAYRWLIQASTRQTRGDTVAIWSIVIAAVFAGFVAAIFVGLAVGCVTFVVRYSRIDAVERRLTATTLRSRLLRSQRESQTLQEEGERIRLFALRGYVFFGIADRLYRELIACCAQIEGPGWIVLDFSLVTGMDSSAAGAFVKLLRHVDQERIPIVFAGMRAGVATRWHRALESDVRPLSFDDNDLALEWCETELLRLFDSYTTVPASLELWLTEQLGSELAGIVHTHLNRVELDTGEVLCAAGESGDRMFFIASGRVAVIFGDTEFQRILSIGSHAMIGEMGLYLHTKRNATVVAEVPTVAFAFSRDALDIIEAEHPIASTWFHAAIVRTLSDRLNYQNGLISKLLR
jgi:SulP family sulfate permease